MCITQKLMLIFEKWSMFHQHLFFRFDPWKCNLYSKYVDTLQTFVKNILSLLSNIFDPNLFLINIQKMSWMKEA